MRGLVLVISSVFVLGCGSGTVAVGPQGTAPVIETQPTGQTVPLGDGATFSVVASGTPTLSYQWQSGGVDIPGATSSSYSIQSTIGSESGAIFDVVVTNPPFGSIMKQEAMEMLGRFDLGHKKKSLPLEVLGLERSLQFLKPGGENGYCPAGASYERQERNIS